MSTQWRGSGENPHPYDGPEASNLGSNASTEMKPCETCENRNNVDIYMSKANE